MSQPVSVVGKIHQSDFGGAEISAHPLGRKERTQAGMEAQTIPTAQGTLDPGTKLVHKAFGNEVFREFFFMKLLLPDGGRVPTPGFSVARVSRNCILQRAGGSERAGTADACRLKICDTAD
jgi:hypothetical protein